MENGVKPLRKKLNDNKSVRKIPNAFTVYDYLVNLAFLQFNNNLSAEVWSNFY